MNKTELVANVAETAGLTKKDAEKAAAYDAYQKCANKEQL